MRDQQAVNFLGIGGLELILVLLIALFVLGPTRLVDGVRTGKKYMTELRRQRDELTQMVEEAVDVETMRQRLDQEGVLDTVRDLSDELKSFNADVHGSQRGSGKLRELTNPTFRPEGYNRRGTHSETPSAGINISGPEASNTDEADDQGQGESRP